MLILNEMEHAASMLSGNTSPAPQLVPLRFDHGHEHITKSTVGVAALTEANVPLLLQKFH